METILSHISDFRTSRKQAAVLVDLRPDQTGTSGLIVDHPRFALAENSAQPLGEFYFDGPMRHRIAEIRAQHLAVEMDSDSGEMPETSPSAQAALGASVAVDAETQPNSPAPAESHVHSIVQGYDDPVTEEHEEDYFAAVEPVFVSRGDEPQYDTGWSILIQERRGDTLAPISDLWKKFVRGGVVGLILIVALLALLWAFVIFVVNRPGDKVLRKGGGATPSGLSGNSSASASAGSSGSARSA